MLADALNGLLVPFHPVETDGRYAFAVTEWYYGVRRNGGDLVVTFRVWVDKADIQFRQAEGGYVLGVRPSAFAKVEAGAARKGADDIAIHPLFARI